MTNLELLELTLEQKEEGIWFSGIPYEGEYKQWHDDGKQLYEHSQWKNGERDGTTLLWYKTGVKWEQAEYSKGLPHGDFYTWDEKGVLQEHTYYSEGDVFKSIVENTKLRPKSSFRS